jgi:transposase
MKKVARTIKKHLDGIITAILNRVTNAKAEGLNTVIQKLKSDARGYRSRERFRNAIYFHCQGNRRKGEDRVNHLIVQVRTDSIEGCCFGRGSSRGRKTPVFRAPASASASCRAPSGPACANLGGAAISTDRFLSRRRLS